MNTIYLGDTPITDIYLGNIPIDASLRPCYSANVGCYYGGGLVIYESGGHGIIAALTDQTSGTYGCPNIALPGAASAAIGSGQANTNALLAAGCGTAAGICDTLSLNGYTDWYLPSLNELALMYNYASQLGISTSGTNQYWSSTSDAGGFLSNYYAAGWDFGTNSNPGLYRTFTYKIRACRSF